MAQRPTGQRCRSQPPKRPTRSRSGCLTPDGGTVPHRRPSGHGNITNDAGGGCHERLDGGVQLLAGKPDHTGRANHCENTDDRATSSSERASSSDARAAGAPHDEPRPGRRRGQSALANRDDHGTLLRGRVPRAGPGCSARDPADLPGITITDSAGGAASAPPQDEAASPRRRVRLPPRRTGRYRRRPVAPPRPTVAPSKGPPGVRTQAFSRRSNRGLTALNIRLAALHGRAGTVKSAPQSAQGGPQRLEHHARSHAPRLRVCRRGRGSPFGRRGRRRRLCCAEPEIRTQPRQSRPPRTARRCSALSVRAPGRVRAAHAVSGTTSGDRASSPDRLAPV